MACPRIAADQIELKIDGEVYPLKKWQDLSDKQSFEPIQPFFRLNVDRLFGRTFHVEVKATFPYEPDFIDPWRLDVPGPQGYILGYNTNPTYMTAPPWPEDISCSRCCSFYGIMKGFVEEHEGNTFPCRFNVNFGMKWSLPCPIVCHNATTRVASSRLISITTSDNTVHTIPGNNFIQCGMTPYDVAANNRAAQAIEAVILSLPTSNGCSSPDFNITISGTGSTLGTCARIDIVKSPAKISHITLDSGSYRFSNFNC